MVAASAKLLPSSGIARKIKNPYINKFIERVRQRYGTSVIYKKGGAEGSYESIKK